MWTLLLVRVVARSGKEGYQSSSHVTLFTKFRKTSSNNFTGSPRKRVQNAQEQKRTSRANCPFSIHDCGAGGRVPVMRWWAQSGCCCSLNNKYNPDHRNMQGNQSAVIEKVSYDSEGSQYYGRLDEDNEFDSDLMLDVGVRSHIKQGCEEVLEQIALNSM